MVNICAVILTDHIWDVARTEQRQSHVCRYVPTADLLRALQIYWPLAFFFPQLTYKIGYVFRTFKPHRFFCSDFNTFFLSLLCHVITCLYHCLSYFIPKNCRLLNYLPSSSFQLFLLYHRTFISSNFIVL